MGGYFNLSGISPGTDPPASDPGCQLETLDATQIGDPIGSTQIDPPDPPNLCGCDRHPGARCWEDILGARLLEDIIGKNLDKYKIFGVNIR